MAQAGKFAPIDKKVQQDKTNRKKWKVLKSDSPQEAEVDVDIEVDAEDGYQVERLALPTDEKLKFNGNSIRWLTNFSIKQNGNFITKSYKVTIPNLPTKLAEKKSTLVVLNEQGNVVAVPTTDINGDTFTLKNGDPAPGMAP